MKPKRIRRVSAISTGSARIRPEHVRSNHTPALWWLATSRSWTEPRPINVYVIEHEDGLVLFDTGQDRRSVTDPSYFPGGAAGKLYQRLARFDIAEDDTLTSRLSGLGYDISDVRTAVVSHLHQDHIGGLRELGHASIVAAHDEWAQLRKPGAVFSGLMSEHIDLPGLHWDLVTPHPTADASLAPFSAAHDLMGDGSLVLVPTPGHTPGSLSLIVRDAGMPPLLFVGDLTYDVDLLSAEHVPGVGNRKGLLASTRLVNDFKKRHPDAVVLAAHDPAATRLLADATAKKAAR
jgi:N-acyl homoserine lactone hydrolase